jgi:hypothetical protein
LLEQIPSTGATGEMGGKIFMYIHQTIGDVDPDGTGWLYHFLEAVVSPYGDVFVVEPGALSPWMAAKLVWRELNVPVS